MSAKEAFHKWMRERECIELRGEVLGYNETPVGITIFLKTTTGVTGIPYPYKYEGEMRSLLAW